MLVELEIEPVNKNVDEYERALGILRHTLGGDNPATILLQEIVDIVNEN